MKNLASDSAAAARQASERLYIRVYRHFRERIESGALLPGSKMPSIRRCSEQLQLSRTTVEAAYLMLAAEGYLYARPQSGYYVTDIAGRLQEPQTPAPAPPPIRYDFTSAGSARDSFSFDLWRRYVKSALRQDDRLLSYGEPQGEPDLRAVLAEYVKEQRNVICSPDDIVIGAGVQSLLNILCPLLARPAPVSFPGPSFTQAITIFENFGYDIRFKDKDADIIYVTPAHMTRWGTIMPVKRRMELIRHAAENGSLIIEDDYENEFVQSQRPTPALHSLAGGRGVVYISTFSRLLLPSFRLSFMVLPSDLAQRYRQIRLRYNQTASKTEQIALCQFIRDGHLTARIRKLRRLYSSRLHLLTETVLRVFGPKTVIETGEGGFTLAMHIPSSLSPEELEARCLCAGIRIHAQGGSDKNSLILLLSCSSLPEEQLEQACLALHQVLF